MLSSTCSWGMCRLSHTSCLWLSSICQRVRGQTRILILEDTCLLYLEVWVGAKAEVVTVATDGHES